MLTLLLNTAGGTSAPVYTLTFVDSVGNPLPAAVGITITSASGTLLTGYLGVGGTVSGTPIAATAYTCAFTGTLAPSAPVTFTATGNAQTITVPNYISTDPSQAGYAQLQTQLWPSGWFSAAAKAPGGNAYNLALTLGWLLNQLDNQWQYVNMSERLQSSTGQDVDSWVADFFGPNLPRNSGETDAKYIARAISNLAAQKGLRAGIQTVASFYGLAWVNEPWMPQETGGYDTNGVLAYDSIGGYGDQNPLIQVFVVPGSQTPAQQTAMKQAIVAARGAGINIQAISVTQTTGGYGSGRYLQAQYGVSSTTNSGTIL